MLALARQTLGFKINVLRECQIEAEVKRRAKAQYFFYYGPEFSRKQINSYAFDRATRDAIFPRQFTRIADAHKLIDSMS